ncbi:hypothetical protein GTW69_06420, partial [Streptomyces sp. SID7760]|nr:hypothetical protein [Streptomyces sp. SID7760]
RPVKAPRSSNRPQDRRCWGGSSLWPLPLVRLLALIVFGAGFAVKILWSSRSLVLADCSASRRQPVG